MNPLQQTLDTALAKHQSGDIAAAAQLYRAILAETPEQPDALHMLGVIAQQKGNAPLALQLMEAALAKKPDLALAWHNRSLVLRVLGRNEDALRSAKNALDVDPALGDAWDVAGALLREAGRYDESAVHHTRAVGLQPKNARYRSNYAVLLLAQGNLADAYKTARAVEASDPQAVAFVLGNILRGAGHTERALRYYQKAGEFHADSNEARLNEAMTWLLLGDMERGWALWKLLPDEKECFRHIPRWQGEKVKHLLLHEDQGIGDALQCIRYLPLVRARAGKITLQLNGYLRCLMAENFPDVTVLTLDDPVPEVDARAQLMNLSSIFETTLATIPAAIPYLHAAEKERTPWRERLKSVAAPRVGFVWAGNPGHRNNRNRSLALEQLDPLLKATQGHAVSLQKWQQKDEAALKVAGLYDADPWLDDFTATAGLIMELDLVITVDTAVAHLAGALGKPVWVLIPFDPDWRWMLGREDSPWYPTMRLFRQTAPRNWTDVLKRMAEELQKFLAGDRTVLQPARWTGGPLRENPLEIKLPD